MHFCVIVFGEDVDALLAPFRLFEVDGVDDGYVEDVDVTEGVRARMAEEGHLADPAAWFSEHYGWGAARSEAELDRSGAHELGYGIFDAEGRLLRAVERTNPNGQWDWWVIGGRYGGMLLTRAGAEGVTGEPGLTGDSGRGGVDQCRLCDLDLGAMRRAAIQARRDAVEDVMARCALSWDETERAAWAETAAYAAWRAGARDLSIPAALKRAAAAGDADAALALRGREALPLGGLRTRVGQSLTAWIEEAAPLRCFGVILDGVWWDRDGAGWCGGPADAEDGDRWDAELERLLKSLPAETRITVVDCHC